MYNGYLRRAKEVFSFLSRNEMKKVNSKKSDVKNLFFAFSEFCVVLFLVCNYMM